LTAFVTAQPPIMPFVTEGFAVMRIPAFVPEYPSVPLPANVSVAPVLRPPRPATVSVGEPVPAVTTFR
jgi:hypothetical protein